MARRFRFPLSTLRALASCVAIALPLAVSQTASVVAEETKSPQPEEAWNDADQIAALKTCLRDLAKIKATVVKIEPVRKGKCGTPAMAEVSALETPDGTITFRPAVELNCAMVVALSRWLGDHVQPAAKRMVGAPLKRLTGVGGYSCRNRNGARSGRLSEHAFGNAFDVARFEFANGRRFSVKGAWGPTRRDLLPSAERSEAPATLKKPTVRREQRLTRREQRRLRRQERREARARRRAERAARRKERRESRRARQRAASQSQADTVVIAGVPPVPTSRDEGLGLRAPVRNPLRVPPGRARREAVSRIVRVAAAAGTVRQTAKPVDPQPTLVRHASRRVVARPAKAGGARAQSSGSTAAARVGKRASKPAPKATVAPPSVRQTPRALFLRQIHADACKLFGTVLGPEANEAHRDHFHLDLAPRKRSNYCR